MKKRKKERKKEKKIRKREQNIENLTVAMVKKYHVGSGQFKHHSSVSLHLFFCIRSIDLRWCDIIMACFVDCNLLVHWKYCGTGSGVVWTWL